MTHYDEIATLAQPEVASVAKRKSIGIRKTSDGSIAVGEVTRIEEDERTERQPKATKATVTIRHGAKRRRKGGLRSTSPTRTRRRAGSACRSPPPGA